MSATENILKVQNVQGAVTSILDRGSDAKLVNQEYADQLSRIEYYKLVGQELADLVDYKLVSYTNDPIKYIPLDVVVRYTPDSSNTITSNPTQFGVNVNDHIYSNPNTMTVVFGVSDIRGSLARMVGVIKSFTSTDALKNPKSPSRSLLDSLYRAKEEHTLFTIDDGLHTYSNMIITNITYDKDKSTYRSLVATATMQQFIFVDEVSAQRPVKQASVTLGRLSPLSSIWDNITSRRFI